MEHSFYFVGDSKFSELPRPPPTPPQYKFGVQDHALRASRGGRGVRTPPEILKANKLLNGALLAGRCWPAFSGILLLSPLKRYCQCCRVGPPLTKLSGSAPEKNQYIDNSTQKPAGAFLGRVQVCRPDVYKNVYTQTH